ncbi:MAG: hypothetical protein AAGD10_03330 [Myxococcota bacterium]
MKTHYAAAFAMVLGCFACGDDEADNGNGQSGNGNGQSGNGAAELEIIGTYMDQFMTETTFSANGVGAATLVEFSNDDNILFTQNPPDAMFGPNAFSRFVWTEPEADGSFFGCFDVFDGTSLEDARGRPSQADVSDPEGGMSCGGAFSFSDYTPVN